MLSAFANFGLLNTAAALPLCAEAVFVLLADGGLLTAVVVVVFPAAFAVVTAAF